MPSLSGKYVSMGDMSQNIDEHYHCMRCARAFDHESSFARDYLAASGERVLVCIWCEPNE